MKKEYFKPNMRVVMLKNRQKILTSSLNMYGKSASSSDDTYYDDEYTDD